MKISVVINTLNEEQQIERCLQSVTWADEIIVWDAESTDKTRDLAQKYTKQVFTHQDKSGFVEAQRNAAIAKASNDWILVLDADEEVPQTLAQKLQSLAQGSSDVSFYEIPRKNFIFHKWMVGSGWWPDYNIRFFKKGSVVWSDRIHVPPQAKGKGEKLEVSEQLAIIHHHYESLNQYLERLNRYTQVQATELITAGYQFHWPDVMRKALSEFLTRFFVWEGYRDGFHGLALSLLQAFSFIIVYLKIWERGGFKEHNNPNFLFEIEAEGKHIAKELKHWQNVTTGKTGIKKYLPFQ